jgi:hypothetical protein
MGGSNENCWCSGGAWPEAAGLLTQLTKVNATLSGHTKVPYWHHYCAIHSAHVRWHVGVCALSKCSELRLAHL